MDYELNEEELKLVEVAKERIYAKVVSNPLILDVIKKYELSEADIKKNLYILDQYLENINKLNDENVSSIEKKFVYTLKFNENDRTFDIALGLSESEIEIKALSKKYIDRDFNKDIMYFDFKDALKFSSKVRLPILKKLSAFVKDEKRSNFYLFGDKKVGKSFIFALFSKSLAKLDSTKSIDFISCPETRELLKSLFDSDIDEFEYELERIKKAQYLFIDDLGKEKYKDFFFISHILYPVLEYRKEKGLYTFITSRYDPKDVLITYKRGMIDLKLRSSCYKILDEDFTKLELRGIEYLK